MLDFARSHEILYSSTCFNKRDDIFYLLNADKTIVKYTFSLLRCVSIKRLYVIRVDHTTYACFCSRV